MVPQIMMIMTPPPSFHCLLTTGMMMMVIIMPSMIASTALAFQTSSSSSSSLLLSSSSNCRHQHSHHHHHHGSSSILQLLPTSLATCATHRNQGQVRKSFTIAAATNNNSGGGENENGTSSASKQQQQQRRRKRKKSSNNATATAPIDDTLQTTTIPSSSSSSDDEAQRRLVQEILAREQRMMNYDDDEFDTNDEDLTSFTPLRLEENDRIAAAAQRAGFSISGNQSSGSSTNSSGEDDMSSSKGVLGGVAMSSGSQLEDLFDSREFLQRKRDKQIEEKNAAESSSSSTTGAVPTKKKIKRSDIKAYNKLLEMDPIADEDASYFEDEGIDFISALLGDVEPGVGNDSDESSNKTGKKVQKKTSFLGIGSGPLQVGHFIGALGVILMAFVEYPGFPLTNLPDPLRASLQGGLGTIYLINTILAVFAAISAPSRNQSAILWGAKTFAVGGIAYDQLMQIPTPEESAENARREEERLNKMSGRRGRGRK